jgi:hypothetical protein
MPITAALERGMAYDRRRYLRRSVSVGAGLFENIRPSIKVTVSDLSVGGCAIVGDLELESGARVWLRLPGLESVPARVAWSQDGRAGLTFDHPYHPAVVERIVSRQG